MIDYQIYKIIHILGLSLLLLGLSGVIYAFALSSNVPAKLKSMTFIFHGVGLFLMLLGGFGMLARLGLVNGLPMWIYAKLAIWLIFGGMVALGKRKVLSPVALVLISTTLVGLASYLAIYKPF